MRTRIGRERLCKKGMLGQISGGRKAPSAPVGLVQEEVTRLLHLSKHRMLHLLKDWDSFSQQGSFTWPFADLHFAKFKGLYGEFFL